MTNKNFALALVLALTVVSAGPIMAAWIVTHEVSWANTLPLSPIIVMWLTFVYHHNVKIRRSLSTIVAYFSQDEISIAIDARFSVSEDITYDKIVEVIRHQHTDEGEVAPIRLLPASGQMVVYMPGWSVQLVLSSSSEPEVETLQSGEHHDLRVAVPGDFKTQIGAKRLLQLRALPLFNRISTELKLPVESARVNLHFERGVNPYLSTYFQNVDIESIAMLKCVLKAGKHGGQATITRDGVTLTAPGLMELSTLAYEHLGVR